MKKLLLTMAALSLTSFSFAQDFGFGDSDFGGSDDFGGSSFEESSAPSVAISGEVGASARAWGGPKNKETGKEDTQGSTKVYDLSKSDVEAGAYANLELNYEGDYTGANLKLKLDNSTLTENKEDVIDEVYATGSFKEGRFQLKAGKMKEVWGKGDKVHVLDNFNANDYSDFIFPDYIDRRLGEVMFKATANLSWDYNLKLEGIYTPWMTPDRFATSGKFVPNKQKGITSRVTNAAMANYSEYLLAVKEADVLAATASTWEKEASIAQEQLTAHIKNGGSATDSTGIALGAKLQAALDNIYATAKTSVDSGTLNTYFEKTLGANYDVIAAGLAANSTFTSMLKTQTGIDVANNAAGVKTVIAMGLADTAVSKATSGAVTTTSKNGANIYKQYITDTVTYVNTKQTLALSNMSSLNSNGDALYPNTKTLRYGQAGVRLTGTFAGIDWGTSYYYGHYKQPSFNAGKLTTYMQKYLANETIEDDDKFLQYDQLQVFGLEAAFVLWKFNTRWEFAYNMTQDKDGTNQAIHNDSIAWVAGFDIDIPLHNLNLNVQETGSMILKKDKIIEGNTFDVDYNSDNKYTRNKVIVLLSDKFLNEKLTVEAQGIYGIECKEYVIVPKIEYNVSEGLTLTAKGAYIFSDNENGEFYNFTAGTEHNDRTFVELSVKYQF